jgi:putative hemolysin
MVRNVFRLDDRQLGSLMISRSDVVFVDIRLSAEENLRRLIESEHSRFPVCDGGLDRYSV